MKRVLLFLSAVVLLLGKAVLLSSQGTVPAFEIASDDLTFRQPARPWAYFDKAGRRFAILGMQSGRFETWAYPLKIFRNGEFSFLLGNNPVPLEGKDLAHSTISTPAVTTLIFVHQSFTVKAHFIAPVEAAGAVVLLEVDAAEPLTILFGFIPVLQPMWPAGLGGQFAFWDDGLKAYCLSEPTGTNHGFVGSPAALRVSLLPAHMFADSPHQFRIQVDEPADFKGKLIPVIMAGGLGSREAVRDVYLRLQQGPDQAYRQAVEHCRTLREATLQITTPEGTLDSALEWAKVALDSLLVENPDLGKGLIAGLGLSGTSGRPGFGWFFGGDAYINSFSLLSYGDFSTVKQALAFTQKWQRPDGKMAHELSQSAGQINWFKDYHYGYIHADTTPYYIVALHDYFRMSGDLAFVKQSWSSLKRAFEWCLSTDGDGDGLMENDKAGLGALEYGDLAGIQTDIYLAAIWTEACRAMRDMAAAVGDTIRAEKAEKNLTEAAKTFAAKFWDESKGYYSYAINKNGGRLPELTPWPAMGLMKRLGDRRSRLLTLERLGSSELATDWGIRILSDKSRIYDSLSYNYGAVWPYLTGFVSLAQFKSGLVLQAYPLLMSSVRHSFCNAPGLVPEVFSGDRNVVLQEATAHQGFSSAAVVFPIVRGLLGLEGSAAEKKIVFAPCLPANWPEVDIRNYRLGEEHFSFHYRRGKSLVKATVRSRPGAGYRVEFSPFLSGGTRILRATVKGMPVVSQILSAPGESFLQPCLEFRLTGEDSMEIVFEPTFAILPPKIETQTGDRDVGPRVIHSERKDDEMHIWVEGLSGREYSLSVLNEEYSGAVSGARLEGQKLVFRIPQGDEGKFLKHEIIVKLKSGAL